MTWNLPPPSVPLSAVSTPAPAIAAPRVITSPAWLQKPTQDDLLKAFPRDALNAGVEGKVVLECKVAVQETLYDCKVIIETPSGRGFGAAGLSVVDKMRMRPRTVNGLPVSGARVRIPLNFKVAGADFDFAMANALPDAERCVGYVFQLTGAPDRDGMLETWTDWYTADAFKAGIKPDEAARRFTASVDAALSAIKTVKGAAEANACRDYYRSWKAQDGDDSGPAKIGAPPPIAVPPAPK
ncbi:MAG TPA: TonB family protein [Caulobacteraceae bacterium]|jgi:TonB family protein|nr:TonB family protein [Caulobacteraceae bacterium]